MRYIKALIVLQILLTLGTVAALWAQAPVNLSRIWLYYKLAGTEATVPATQSWVYLKDPFEVAMVNGYPTLQLKPGTGTGTGTGAATTIEAADSSILVTPTATGYKVSVNPALLCTLESNRYTGTPQASYPLLPRGPHNLISVTLNGVHVYQGTGFNINGGSQGNSLSLVNPVGTPEVVITYCRLW